MWKSLFIVLSVVLLLWAFSGTRLFAQNRTAVTLEFKGDEKLKRQVETGLSRLLTELNRASYFEDRPDLTEHSVTEAGKEDLLEHWARARFRCPKTTLERALVPKERGGDYTLASIPLLVESDTGGVKRRSGLFVVNPLGQIDGFSYRSEQVTAPEEGTITVRTEPPEAVVVSAIGEGSRQRAPARFEEVDADAYAFTIRKEKYQSVVDTTLVVYSNRSVEHTIQLTPRPGYIQVEGVQSGATFRINDSVRSLNKEIHQVPAGSLQVSVSRQHYASWDSTVTVPPGDTMSLALHLRRAQIPLLAHSSPAGATVLLNGTAVGKTPLDTTLDKGRSYTLQFDKNGYVPSRNMRIVVGDSAIERRIVLMPVEVHSDAENAKLANLQVQRSAGTIDLTYSLIGQSDETYGVALEAIGPNGTPIERSSDAVKGAVGEEISPGSDKRISWRGEFPEGTTLQLRLREKEGSSRLLYVIGGAIAAGGGTMAALLLGGGEGGGNGGGGGSFPPPPGFPN